MTTKTISPQKAASAPKDGIALIKAGHEAVSPPFAAYEKARSVPGKKAPALRAMLARHEPIHQHESGMYTPFAVIAVCAVALALGACDRTPDSPPAPIVNPVQVEAGAAAEPAASTSVPPADSVFSPAIAAKAASAAGRSNSAMSAAQQSTAMPMPGQNNDHSAPLAPARRASAP